MHDNRTPHRSPRCVISNSILARRAAAVAIGFILRSDLDQPPSRSLAPLRFIQRKAAASAEVRP